MPRDAARVACYVARAGFSFEDIVKAGSEGAASCFGEFIREYVEKQVFIFLCDRFSGQISRIASLLLKASSPVRRARLILEEMDAVLTDIENFSILGTRVIPLSLTRVPRVLVDELLELNTVVEQLFSEVTDFVEELASQCD